MSDIDSLQTYYTLLNIEEEATAAEVRKAYLRRAAECHPDKHPEDEDATERFQALGEAYECLKDPEARKEYDLKLLQLRDPNSGPSSGSPPRGQYGDRGDYEDFRHHEYHDHPAFHPHPAHPHPYPRSHLRHTFFRMSGFSPFPPFPRAFQTGGGIPTPLARMFAEIMSGFPRPGGPRLGPGPFDLPFRVQRKGGQIPPNPFGPMDPFDIPFLPSPFLNPGLAPPPPPPPHFRHRPYPSQRHHHPYPFPPNPSAQMRPPGPILPHLGGLPPGIRPPGPEVPGRCHRAVFEIRDPAGRRTGFAQQSTMSWGSGFR